MRPPSRSGPLEHAEALPGRRGRRLGVALGAGAAALVSAGLAYWIGSGGGRSLSSTPSAPAASAPVAYAGPRPDAGQVLRAYDQVQAIYADQGSSGVIGFSRACADSLRGDPGMLDFCLAFDVYAAVLDGDDAAAADWEQQAQAHDLALAQSVLPPGQDPAVRLAEVRELARQASLEAPDEAESPAAPQSQSPPANAHRAESEARAAAAARAQRASEAQACRHRATAGERAVCASPALREADRRLRLAYRRALAAGVSSRRLAHEQARFRAAVDKAAPDRAAIARLYHRRTRALEQLAHPT